MDLRRLQVFAKVYQRRSFSRAAEEIFLSQPTVSGHIKSLEEDLGVRLFDRLGREILPTSVADLLFAYASNILATVEEARSAVDVFVGRLRGEVVLGGSTTPGQYVLPELLGRFRELNPEVKVNLEIGSSAAITAMVLTGRAEAGVVGAEPGDERLAATPLMDDTICLTSWPGHPLAGKRISVSELCQWPVVLREVGSGTRSFVNQALKKAGLSSNRLEVAAHMGSNLALLGAVKARLGMGFLSCRALWEDLREGRIVEVGVDGLDLHRQFYLITRVGRTHSPAADAFMAHCLAELDDRAPARGGRLMHVPGDA